MPWYKAKEIASSQSSAVPEFRPCTEMDFEMRVWVFTDISPAALEFENRSQISFPLLFLFFNFFHYYRFFFRQKIKKRWRGGGGGRGYEKGPKVCHRAQDPRLNFLQH